MIPVEAEDIPLVKQIAQVPQRVLHRTEWHADRRVAVRVAAGPAGQVSHGGAWTVQAPVDHPKGPEGRCGAGPAARAMGCWAEAMPWERQVCTPIDHSLRSWCRCQPPSRNNRPTPRGRRWI